MDAIFSVLKKRHIDAIFIEASDASDPVLLAQALFVDDKLSKKICLDGIVTGAI